MSDKIFIQIASYRDLQLLPTIEDLIAKADHPERFTFGICWQYGENEEDPNVFDGKPEYRVLKVPYKESKGLGWARNKTNLLYQGEEYTLQIDSHHRFAQGWDTMLLEDFEQASKMSSKPVVTTYCTPFTPNTEKPELERQDITPCLMCQYEFSSDKLLMSRPWYIQDFRQRSKVIRARTISCHFFFTRGEFIKEVPYDPEIYFGGYTEETTLSARAFTHGWDFFSPYRQYIWHEYTRSYRPKHWEDHNNTTERDVFSRNKTRQLFEQEHHDGIDTTVGSTYGLGTQRTLHDYEVFGGFDFKRCRIQEYTLQVREPPNSPDWENQFPNEEYKFDKDITWDTDRVKKDVEELFNGEDVDFIAMGIQTNTGLPIHRVDYIKGQHSEVEVGKCHLTFSCSDKPSIWVMYPHCVNGKWGTRQEGSVGEILCKKAPQEPCTLITVT